MTRTATSDCADRTRLQHSVRVLAGTRSRHLGSEMRRIGLDPEKAALEEKSAQFYILELHRLSKPAAAALESGLASVKAHFAIGPGSAGGLSMIAGGTRRQFEELAACPGEMAPEEPAILKSLLEAIDNYTRSDFVVPYPGGKLDLSKKTAVMGVINVTPDSFSDGGDCFSADQAVERALKMAEAGADIIDIGGESTRPGSDPVSAKEEIARITPVIKTLSSKTNIPLSIDTYKPEVASAALDAGARIVNDITGLRENAEMAEIVTRRDVPVVLMHMKGRPKTMQVSPAYDDLILDVYSSLARSVETALSRGIKKEKLIIDPGIGFGKTFEDNLVILDRLHEFRSLGPPVCIGVSRKAFIGAALGISEPRKRLFGSVSAGVIAVRGGAKIVRVHDVKEMVEAVRVADAIAAGRLPREA